MKSQNQFNNFEWIIYNYFWQEYDSISKKIIHHYIFFIGRSALLKSSFKWHSASDMRKNCQNLVSRPHICCKIIIRLFPESSNNCKIVLSKIIFSEKSLSVHMSVCLSRPVCPVLSRPQKKSLKQKILLNKVVRCTSRMTKTQSCCIAGQGEAELRIFNFKTTL